MVGWGHVFIHTGGILALLQDPHLLLDAPQLLLQAQHLKDRRFPSRHLKTTSRDLTGCPSFS